jgi:hypothetical protein
VETVGAAIMPPCGNWTLDRRVSIEDIVSDRGTSPFVIGCWGHFGTEALLQAVVHRSCMYSFSSGKFEQLSRTRSMSGLTFLT